MNEQPLVPQEVLAMIGSEVGPGEPFEVEKEAIRRFAEAIMEEAPNFVGLESAKSSPVAPITAPLTFPLYNCRSGIDRDLDIPLDAPRRIRGGDEFQFLAPVLEGDVIRAKTKLLDIYAREGTTGRMAFIVTETTYINQREETVMINRATIIRR